MVDDSDRTGGSVRWPRGRQVGWILAICLVFAGLVPAAQASFDKRTVKRVIESAKNRNAVCYRELLGRAPGVEGRLVMSFTIRASGTVEEATVTASSIEDDAFNACVTAVFSSLRFPTTTEDTKITYPMSFRPEDAP